MSLLPKNSSLQEQKFASLLDTQSRVSYEDITNDPMLCDESLLPHIALIKGANIDNMLVHEARAYLKTFRRKLLGTIGSVEDAVNAVWADAKVIEWMNEDSLEVGMFRVDVTLKADTSLVYDDRLFSLSKRLIKKSKNIRSQLESFDIHLPLITAEVLVSSGSDPLKVSPFMSINELIISDDIPLNGGWVFNSTLDTNIDEGIALDTTTLIGGYKWQVEV